MIADLQTPGLDIRVFFLEASKLHDQWIKEGVQETQLTRDQIMASCARALTVAVNSKDKIDSPELKAKMAAALGHDDYLVAKDIVLGAYDTFVRDYNLA